jgi:phospholipid/cholesterol/gamma-HCH transport system substrate-binding protein
METRASYITVGAFVLAAITGLIVVVVWLSQSEFNRHVDVYYTYFTGSVTGLQGGSPVRYRGVPVGTVGNVEIDPTNVERIRVTLNLNPGTPIKTDSVATLETQGITGGAYVEISGGTQSAPPLTAPDDRIPVIPSQSSSLMSLVDDAPKLLAKLMAFVDRLNDGLSASNIQAISDTITHLRSLSVQLDKLGPDASQAAANVNRLSATLDARLPGLIDTLNQDGAKFGDVARNLDTMIGESRGPIRDFASNGLPQLSSLISELRGLTQTLTHVADRLDRDPQRYLFGAASTQGLDPNRPVASEEGR